MRFPPQRYLRTLSEDRLELNDLSRRNASARRSLAETVGATREIIQESRGLIAQADELLARSNPTPARE